MPPQRMHGKRQSAVDKNYQLSILERRKTQQREANFRKRCKQKIIDKILSQYTVRDFAFNLNLLVDGWLELESDPGTFTLLLEDFGCFGAQVEEVYDLDQKFDEHVYGFIFLFRWLHNQNKSSSSKTSSVATISDTTNSTYSNSYNNSLSVQEPTTLEPTKRRDSRSSSISASAFKTRANSYNTSKVITTTNISNTTNTTNTNNNEQPQQQDQASDWSYVEDENILGSMFFARQMISNSCATHALISILLNCDHKDFSLGPVLTRLKEYTKVMNPENKGYAIGNLPELAKAHNSHASFLSLYNKKEQIAHQANSTAYVISGNQRTNMQQQNQHEAFHFVSYVPINNRLYELDGLKNYPIDHGPVGPGNEWTEKFRSIIKKRLSSKTGETTPSSDIRYSLMTVVPDKRIKLTSQLKKLKENRDIINENINQMTKQVVSEVNIDIDIPNPPYSPLSNQTLTASEASSAFNSPVRCENAILPERSEGKIDRFILVNFSSNSNQEEPKTLIEANSDNATTTTTSTTTATNITTSKEDDNEFESTATITTTESSETTSVRQIGSLICKTEDEEIENKNRSDYINRTFDQLMKSSSLDQSDEQLLLTSTEPSKAKFLDLVRVFNKLEHEIEKIEENLKEEIDKRKKYKIDDSRRTHNYEPFIISFLAMLAQQGNLAELVEQDLTRSDKKSKLI